jgi:hypothetical protein
MTWAGRGPVARHTGGVLPVLFAAMLLWPAAASLADEKKHDEDLVSVDLGGGATARFKGIGVETAFAAGYSSADDEELEGLQGGDHDPDKNGFTFQSLAFGFFGGVDPYFDAEVHLAINLDGEGETVLELEEAFMRTQEGVLPGGLEFEVGQFLTEFGRYNPVHFEEQPYLDQPVIMSRFFGEDGLRGPGFRLGWGLPTPWSSMLHLGMQNATGETQSSFLSSDEAFDERPIGGHAFEERKVDGFDEFTYLARLANDIDIRDTEIGLGGSFLYGPNATGKNRETLILGADFAVHQELSGHASLKWDSEFLYRDYETPEDDLKDYGLYTQVMYGFNERVSAGVRYEFAGGGGDGVGGSDRDDDPFRADRHRFSPLVAWEFVPNAKVRLQYNYDKADHLADDDAHAIWLGFQWSFGVGHEEDEH